MKCPAFVILVKYLIQIKVIMSHSITIRYYTKRAKKPFDDITTLQSKCIQLADAEMLKKNADFVICITLPQLQDLNAFISLVLEEGLYFSSA